MKKDEEKIAYGYAFYAFKVKFILEAKEDGSLVEPILQFSIFNLFLFPVYYFIRALYYFRWMLQATLLGESVVPSDYVPFRVNDEENKQKIIEFLDKQN